MLVLFAALASAPALLAAQEEAPPAAQALRVYVDCEVCDEGALAPPPWIEWVGDSTVADVHVRIVPARPASTAQSQAGASSAASADAAVHYVLSFSGRRGTAARADTLPFTPAGGSAEARRSGLLQAVQLGLVRYAAESPLGARLQIGLARDPHAPPPAGSQAPARAAAAASPRLPAAQRRWAASVDLGFSGSSGNSDFVALTSGVRVRHLQTNRFKLDWSANFRYGESGGSVAARHTQSKLDFDLGPSARVAPFISMSGERDPFRRLDLRARGGTGARFALYRADRGEAAIRAALLYTHERFRPEADRQPRSEGVWSFKFTGNRQLGENIKVETSSSYDPAVGDFGDYNLDLTSKLSTRISRRLALTVAHTFAYDATPVAGVQPSDQRYQTGLTVDF
jgi:putative salt-induced outer membrane protein YdiY